jgi:TonB family protein
LSQDLYDFLKQRARMTGLPLGLCLTVSLGFHLALAGAIIFTSRAEAQTQEVKVTWVTLPGLSSPTPAGGSAPAEVGKQGERLRRVEEVAPKRAEPAPRAAQVTPNAFGTRPTRPAQGTNPNPDSLGKAPVAAKGKVAAANPGEGAAGQGGGGGIGVGGASAIPGLRASSGIEGGTGLISDLDGSFPFIWYLQQVQNRITGNWNRLTSAQGRVQIYFRIRKDGGIEGARVDSPSGNGALDQSALLAVRRSDPLPPLPEGASLGVRFWFTYVGN